jgi:hypothetical protein
MKKFVYFWIAIIALGLVWSCKKSNKSSKSDKSNGFTMTGTRQFSGLANYIDSYFVVPPLTQDSVSETFTTVIQSATSPDSSDYVYLPVAAQIGPWGEPYIIFTNTQSPPGPDNAAPVAMKVTDTLLTIPEQYPWSGAGLYVVGSGSFVNNKITLTYHSWYREFNKYSTVVSTQ